MANRTQRISIRVTTNVVEALEAKATEKWLCLSDVARTYLLDGMALDGAHPVPPGPVRRRGERRKARPSDPGPEHAAA